MTKKIDVPPVKVLYIRCGDYGTEPILTSQYCNESLKTTAQRFINVLVKKKKEVKNPMHIFLADASDTIQGIPPKKMIYGIDQFGMIKMKDK